MNASQRGEYIALTAQLFADGPGWALRVSGAGATHVIPLRPAVFVIRLWRDSGRGTLRGWVQLERDDGRAPIHSSLDLEHLVRAWLFGK